MTRFPLELRNLLQLSGVSRGDTLLLEIPGEQDLAQGTVSQEQVFVDMLQGLQELLGLDGLLVVPTCSYHEGEPKPAFHLHNTSSEMGAFSEWFRAQDSVQRSNHPTHSLAAWGAEAAQFTSGHRYAHSRQTPWGESALGQGSPWDRLIERDAWWLMVDPDWSDLVLSDFASALLWQRSTGIVKETPFPDFSPDWLAEHFVLKTGAKHVNLEGRQVYLFHARNAIDALLDAALRSPGNSLTGADVMKWLSEKVWVEQHGYLLAGIARVPITPRVPFLRWDGKPVTGVYRDLYARALFLQSGDQRFALVVCDLLGITRDVTADVRRQVTSALGGEPLAITIACTHAHSTPDTIAAGFSAPEYRSFLVEQITLAICQAAESREPVRMGWSKTTIRGIAHSRRWRLKDGRVFTTRYGVPSTWRVSSERIAEQGVIDPELTVMRVERLNSSPLAVVTNFAAHPSIALASSNASGDFSGEAMRLLEGVYGPDALALCTTGAAGDVDPTLEMPVWGPRNEQNALRIARLFAAQAVEALEHTAIQEHHEIRVASSETWHPVRSDWIHLVAEDAEGMQTELAAGRVCLPYLQEILTSGGCTLEVQAIRLNGLVLLAFPGEVFSSTSLQLKEQFGYPVMVIETANDYAGYIYPEAIFQEGGYECSLHFAARLTPGSEVMLRASALQAARETARPGRGSHG